MPPIKKFSKIDIVNKALEIVEHDGMDSLNARRLAHELNSSVQPIFHNFASMEDLKKELYLAIYDKYKEYMARGYDEKNPYKAKGLSYIKFARDYPEFFKIVFMQETNLNAKEFVSSDDEGNDVIKTGMLLTKLSYEEQKEFHVKVWIFTHGIACLVATKTINITDEEINKLLEESVREMIIGYKKEKYEKYN